MMSRTYQTPGGLTFEVLSDWFEQTEDAGTPGYQCKFVRRENVDGIRVGNRVGSGPRHLHHCTKPSGHEEHHGPPKSVVPTTLEEGWCSVCETDLRPDGPNRIEMETWQCPKCGHTEEPEEATA